MLYLCVFEWVVECFEVGELFDEVCWNFFVFDVVVCCFLFDV